MCNVDWESYLMSWAIDSASNHLSTPLDLAEYRGHLDIMRLLSVGPAFGIS